MLSITVEDCKKLEKDFLDWTFTIKDGDQICFMALAAALRLHKTNFEELVKNQKEARSMFRCIKFLMKQDFSEYIEEGDPTVLYDALNPSVGEA